MADCNKLPEDCPEGLKHYFEEALLPRIKQHDKQLLKASRRGVKGMWSLLGLKLFPTATLAYRKGGNSLEALKDFRRKLDYRLVKEAQEPGGGQPNC